jgi:hypothetical protein
MPAPLEVEMPKHHCGDLFEQLYQDTLELQGQLDAAKIPSLAAHV